MAKFETHLPQLIGTQMTTQLCQISLQTVAILMYGPVHYAITLTVKGAQKTRVLLAFLKTISYNRFVIFRTI